MPTLMIIGSSLGLLIGLVHARGVYVQRVRDAGPRARISAGRARFDAGYGAFWTVVLWTLFGTYVLVLWLISIPLWLGARALGAAFPLVSEA